MLNNCIRKEGDERSISRLLTFLTDRMDIYQINRIRKNVLFLHTSTGKYILKGYLSRKQLKLQRDFTIALKRAGFRQTAIFIKKKPIFVNPYFYGWQRYIEKGFPHFHYRHERDRIDGLQLLSMYHRRSKTLLPQFQQRVSPFRPLKKWRLRFYQFQLFSEHITAVFPKPYLQEIISWGNEALVGMEKYRGDLQLGQQVVLHGDVAHHNFIRSPDRSLYLIDFDLIHTGDAVIDMIQYANRILPSIGWSLEKLSSYHEFKPYLKNKAFLFALIYPTDIYREWNRWVRSGESWNTKYFKNLFRMTMEQFDKRQHFIHEVRNVIN